MARRIDVLLLAVLGLCGLPVAAQDAQKSRLQVYLPAPNTKLTIQGVPLKVTPQVVRIFESPPLEPKKIYVYDVQAEWTENGKTMKREQSVKVMAGLTAELDLRQPTKEAPVPEEPAPQKPEDSSLKPVPAGDSPSKKKPDVSDAQKPSEKPMDKPAPKADEKPAAPTTDSPKQPPLGTPMKSPSPAVPEKPAPSSNSDLAAPLIATPPEIVEFMLLVAKVRETDVVYDVGCADGRIALTAVRKFGVRKAVGIDSNPDRIAAAQKAAANLGPVIEFRRIDLSALTENDLADATVVTIDNTSEKQLTQLAPILKKLKVGTRIVTHEFEIPGMRRDDKREKTVDGLDHLIYLYTIR
jgi:uncharacterized protein (TIGR03000 family)